MTRKRLPIHLGEILREELLKPYQITSQKLVQEIKVDPEKIKAIVEERENIDAGLSCRLGLFLAFEKTID